MTLRGEHRSTVIVTGELPLRDQMQKLSSQWFNSVLVPGGVTPYMGNIGTCRGIGYGF